MNDKSFLKYWLSAFNAQLLIQIVHPLDLIRTRLQSHDGLKEKNLVPNYRSLRAAFTRIFKEEGLRGFSKGFLISMLNNCSASALFFSIYETSKNRLPQTNYQHFLASIIASSASVVVTQPGWVIKTRIMLNCDKQILGINNFRSNIRQVYQQHGMLGFYRGFTMSILLCSHGIIQINFYELLKGNLFQNYHVDTFMNGMISKGIAIYATYPLSTIRTRIQQDQYINDMQPKYRNIREVFLKTLKHESIWGFYKGVIPSLIRGIPSRGFYFFFYESFKQW